MNSPQPKKQFDFTDNYMQITITSTIELCSQTLEGWGIRWIIKSEDTRNRKPFRFFSTMYCVQRIPRLKKNQISYYSGKYRFHCLKMQAAFGPHCFAVDFKEPCKGVVHDKIIQE